MIDDADQRRLASHIFDAIGDQLGVDVFVLKYGPNAEGGLARGGIQCQDGRTVEHRI